MRQFLSPSLRPRVLLSLLLLLLLLTAVLPGCGFLIRPSGLYTFCGDGSDYSEVESDPPAVVLEDPSTIVVMHGSGRARSPRGGALMVQQSVELPLRWTTFSGHRRE